MKKISHLSALDKASLILAVALIVCLLPLPYGFYTLIRLATTIIAACWVYRFYIHHRIVHAIIAGTIALLFQPLIKVTLDRLTWNIVDIILAIGIVYVVIFSQRKL